VEVDGLQADMRVLALDTSAGACSAAVLIDGRCVQRLRELSRGHAEVLMPMVVKVMAEAACAFDDLTFVAVTVGPGAFTGLRIGLASARGIALAAGIACVGVTTLEAIAEAADQRAADRPILAALDSGRGDMYAQLFVTGRPAEKPLVRSLDSIVARFLRQPIALAGAAAPAIATALRSAGGDAIVLGIPGYPTAARVAAVAGRRWAAGDRSRSFPSPLYLSSPAVGPQQRARGPD
jgi:tRNA threonylcarbamoyladenosine biosynthesis protein TsaB